MDKKGDIKAAFVAVPMKNDNKTPVVVNETAGGFTPASISWHNLNVYSKRSDNGKQPVQILKNVTGELKAGQTLAIMGSSGAGKTTLLNVLTARNLSEFRVDGVVKINNRIADVDTITSMSAYVQQLDLLIPILTVREHLIFQSMVRMPANTSDDARLKRVADVMSEMSLEKCADTFVGSSTTFKGISGGEMKRLSMAIEILTNPSIMFCDEPTSGLDSFMAASLIQYIDKMAETGRTIICTIHQPASDVFALFKNLCLMADGRVAYMGKVSEAIGFFSQLGMTCPSNYNPADFYIQELAIAPGREIECRKKVNRICDYFDTIRPSGNQGKTHSSFVRTKPEQQGYKATRWQQYQALAWRAFLVVRREPMLTYVRLMQSVFVSTFVGTIFLNQVYDTRGVMNINGAMFGALISLTMQNCFAVVNVFCAEMPTLIRDYNSGMYSVDAYYLTKNLAEMPVFILIPILNTSIYYYMIGLKPFFDAYLYFMVVAICISVTGVSFGYFISTLFTNTDIALSVGSPVLVPIQLVGGFFLNTKSIAKGLVWLQYLSWFQYGFDLLVVNQWRGAVKLDCIKDNGSDDPLARSFCFKNGAQVMHFVNFGHRDDWVDFVGILMLILSMRGLGFLALYLRARHSR